MRIVTGKDLRLLSAGTLFAEAYGPDSYGALCVYGGTSGNDFLERPIEVPESSDTGEHLDRSEAMWTTGKSFPVNTAYGREGLFDPEQRYLVYESADIASIFQELSWHGM
jgi:hypothetical protein